MRLAVCGAPWSVNSNVTKERIVLTQDSTDKMMDAEQQQH